MIWIIGNKGMLGRELGDHLREAGLSFIGTDREVDILSRAALEEKAAEISPDWIVNCSAYTAVDKAEEEEEAARSLNRDGVAHVGRCLLFISPPTTFLTAAPTRLYMRMLLVLLKPPMDVPSLQENRSYVQSGPIILLSGPHGFTAATVRTLSIPCSPS
jgi:hypothetical protein